MYWCVESQVLPAGNIGRKGIMTSKYSLRISAVCCLCLSVLFLIAPCLSTADYNSGVTAKILAKTTVTANGQKILYPSTDRAEVTAMTVELAPGAETGWHKHPVPVYAYVVSGNLSVALEDGRELSYSAGDAVIEVFNVMHNGKNRGSKPVNLAVFYLGVEGAPSVIKAEPPENAKR